jgi:hypothetical protein
MNAILSSFKQAFKPTKRPVKNALKTAQTSVNMGLSAWELLISQSVLTILRKSLPFGILRVVSL